MNPTRERGVTLIELLIAVSLLSLLSVGMLVAMRIGFSTMDKVDEHLVRNRRATNARKIIENEIQGFTLTLADWRPQPDRVIGTPFVEWQSDHMRFVTAYSLQDAWRGRPQIAEMQVIPGGKGEGVRLIVNETPYTGSAQTGTHITLIDTEPHFAPILPGALSFVLADQLAYCRFEYLQGEPRSSWWKFW